MINLEKKYTEKEKELIRNAALELYEACKNIRTEEAIIAAIDKAEGKRDVY